MSDTPASTGQTDLLRLLSDVRLRARRLLWVYGLSATLAVLVSLTTFAALLDWSVQVNDSVVRLFMGLAILLVTGRVAWISWIRPLRKPLTNLALARQFERQDGSWKDQLSSVVQFLEAGFDPALGSPNLQRRVMQDALTRLPRLESAEILQSRPALGVAWAAMGVMSAAAILVVLDQSSAALALERLVRPFSGLMWPKQVDLAFFDENWNSWESRTAPLRVVQGETLQVFIENRLGELPENIVMSVRSAEGDKRTEPVRRVSVPDSQGDVRDVAVATLMTQPGLWSLRASGGDDDDMPWHLLEVIPPPSLSKLRVTLTPPPYSALSPLTLPEGIGHVDGLIGTEVEIRAEANRPLSHAALRIKDRNGLPLELADDGTNLTARFRIEEPGKYAYWFDLKDREGFQNPNARRYEIEGRADAVPEVTLREPRDDMTVTADAVIPLEIEVRDDQGIDQLFLELSLGDMSSGPPVRQLLTTAVDHIPAARPRKDADKSDGETGATTEHVLAEQVKELRWKEDWSLAALALTEGSRLNFVAAASDLYDLNPDHIGRSRSRTLTVVSAAQKTAELAARQEQMLKTLVEVHQAQRQARDAIRELHLKWQETGQLQSDDLDLFQRVEREQQQIAKQLFGPVTSVQQQAQDWLTDFGNNGLTADEMRDRVADLTQELDWLQREIYPALETEMTQTGKRLWNRKDDKTSPAPTDDEQSEQPATDSAEPSADENPNAESIDRNAKEDADDDPNSALQNESAASSEQREQPSVGNSASPSPPREKFNSRAPRHSLARIEDYQSTALDTLDDLVHTISDWKDLRTVTTEWQELMNLQSEATKQTADTSRETLTKNFGELTDEQRAALAKTAAKQQDVSDRLQQFRERIGKMTADEDDASDEERDVLNELSEGLADSPVAGRMQEAAASIRKNELGQAGAAQQKIESELAELRDILHQKRETDTETLIKKLKQFEETADELIAEQRDIGRQSGELTQDDADEAAERLELVKRQQKNIEQSRRLAHRLRREGLESSREPFERAGEEMQNASDNLLADEPEQLRKRHDDAGQALEHGRRELAKARRELERQLARELAARLEQEVQALLERQTAMTEEIRRLQSEYLAKQRWTRGQLKTLRDTGAGQSQIAADVAHIAERLQEAPVFAYSMKNIAEGMLRVTDRLNERQVDEQTVGYASTAVRQLADLLAALAKPKNDEREQQPGLQPGEQQQADGPPTPDLPQTAQVRLLKELQTALRQKTADWHAQQSTATELTAAAAAERRQLADEQQALFELAQTLLQSLAGWDPTSDETAPPAEAETEEEAAPAEDDSETPEESGETSQLRPQEVRMLFASFYRFEGDAPLEEEESSDTSPSEAELQSVVEAAMQLRESAQRVIASMQAAQEQLSRGEAGSPAQDQQRQAEQAIDELLKQLEQLSQQPPPSDDNSQQSQDEKQKRQGDKQQQDGSKNGEGSGAAPNGKRQKDDQPHDSTDNIFPGEAGEENLTVPQKLAKDVWGHLPASVREQMLNLFSEKYLPRYEDLIRRYYEALAEEEMQDDRGAQF
ncbi:MAG: hypothetical protein WEB58_22685 [Planctomycetaceae bacterium]